MSKIDQTHKITQLLFSITGRFNNYNQTLTKPKYKKQKKNYEFKS